MANIEDIEERDGLVVERRAMILMFRAQIPPITGGFCCNIMPRPCIHSLKRYVCFLARA